MSTTTTSPRISRPQVTIERAYTPDGPDGWRVGEPLPHSPGGARRPRRSRPAAGVILRDRAHAAAVLAAHPGTHVAASPKDRPMTDRIVTPSETANRAAVAIDLADALADMPNGTDPDAVRRLPDRGWKLAAERAGCTLDYVPSLTTRETVVRILERRRAAEGADPFRGFPS